MKCLLDVRFLLNRVTEIPLFCLIKKSEHKGSGYCQLDGLKIKDWWVVICAHAVFNENLARFNWNCYWNCLAFVVYYYQCS